jgi:hypothetical protein
VLDETLEPCPWCLTETIERPGEQADVVWAAGINKPSGLLTVHLFLKVAVEESVGDVKLVSWPVVSSHKRQHGTNRGRLDHRRERLPEINTGPLVEPTDDPTCLVSREGAIWIHLVLEDPFAGDDSSTWRPRDKSPSVVGLQCIKFGLHCSIPMGIFDSGANAAGNRRYCLRGHEGVLRVRASPTMPQTNASNRNIGLYTGKTTPTVPQFNKFSQKTIRHPLKCLKYTTP